MLSACPPLRWEAGEPRGPDYAPSRVAILAHWSQQPAVSRSVEEFLAQLRGAGFDIIVSSSADCVEPLKWTALPVGATVYRRPNLGYDFGSWSQVLDLHPGIRSADIALLVNDSLVGPFAPLDPLLDQMAADPRKVWGLVSTSQDAQHLQSHFIAFKQSVLQDEALRRFWDGIRIEPSKRKLVKRYEIGLAWTLLRAGIGVSAGFDWEQVVLPGGNPTSQGWRRLLLLGFPFVKRELVLRPPPEVPDAADIPDVVRTLFGQEVMEWV